MDVDPLEQVETLQLRVERCRDGHLIAREESSLRTCLYLKPELMMMLEQAGFCEISVLGAYTEAPPTADQGILVFIAKK